MMSVRPIILAMCVACFGALLTAQTTAQTDQALKGVDVTEKIGKSIPLDLTFTDDNGQHVKLRQYFKKGRPVLITLNYAGCPNLCGYQLDDLANAFKAMDWVPGKQFVALRVSVDPGESVKTARQNKLRYVGVVGKPEADSGWHFLTTSDKGAIRKLADALGYGFNFDEKNRVFRHKLALMLVNGEGKISHYLRNIGYKPDNLEAKLKESAKGQLGQPSPPGTGFGLNCFSQPYTDNMARAYNMMKAGGVGILVFLFGFVGYWWVRELRKPRQKQAQAEATG